MLARVTSYPPLGDDTVVDHTKESVRFTVLFESASPQLQQQQQKDGSSPATPCPWEVQLWHNFNDEHAWTATTLQLETLTANDNLFRPHSSASAAAGDTVIYRFTAAFEGRPKGASRPVSFTIRFRAASSNNAWIWMRDQSGVDDGKLLYQQQLPSNAQPSDLKNYLDQISPDLQIAAETSQATDTLLWSIQGDAKAASGETSGFTTHSLGLPSNFTQWFALVRCLTCWILPYHGKGRPLANRDAIIYSFKRHDGVHLVLLAISGIKDVLTVFQYTGDSLAFTARNDREQKGTAQVLAAVGYSYDNAAAAVIYHARSLITKLSTNKLIERQVDRIESQKSDEVRANWMQDWYDGFTYCTWNGLGKDLTEQKISDALKSLKDNGIQISNLIIDDNWQSLDNDGQISINRGWTEFEANKEGFSNGLKSAVQSIRAKNPELAHVGVWHAILGYWGGISVNGKIAKGYKTIKVKKRGGVYGQESYFVDAAEATRLYNDFYKFLQDCGIDSVKTDVQNMLDEIDTAPERRAFTSTYLDTWITAQLKYFGGHAISCMSQAPANLFHTQLPTNIPRLCVRNSDDFFPDVEASHPWHIFCNAHNSLFTKHLNVLPDWDMFQTDHDWASFHAAARCISGGPIYITDHPGKHSIALIRQMTAQVVRNNQTVILRPSVIGRSANIYVGYEEQRLCLISAYNGAAQTGASFLGVFNCRDQPLQELIPFSSSPTASKFMGIEKEISYVVRSFASGRVSNVISMRKATGASAAAVAEEEHLVQVSIAGQGWDILTATPVSTFTQAQQQKLSCSSYSVLHVSNLGLIDKLSGAAAIIGTSSSSGVKDVRTRIRIQTKLKALGTLGLYISELPSLSQRGVASAASATKKIADNGLKYHLMILLERRPIPFESCVSVSTSDACVLQIDLETAWREMKLDAGLSNEVEVETSIFLSPTPSSLPPPSSSSS